eukprot:m.477570 g.477570  ORF g.477570 m.477570 type:complete len:471 (-) comp20864_c0_seq1:142-1554(-)
MQYKDGSIFEGEWMHDHPEGQGKMTNNQYSYEGEWHDGLQHGTGKQTFRVKRNANDVDWEFVDMDRYEGNFEYGNMSGEGTYAWANGQVYTGTFEYGKVTGKGTITFTDGRSYTGAVVGGVPHGPGKMKYPDSLVYEGEWREGMRDGAGSVRFPDGRHQEGQFLRDEPVDFEIEPIFRDEPQAAGPTATAGEQQDNERSPGTSPVTLVHVAEATAEARVARSPSVDSHAVLLAGAAAAISSASPSAEPQEPQEPHQIGSVPTPGTPTAVTRPLPAKLTIVTPAASLQAPEEATPGLVGGLQGHAVPRMLNFESTTRSSASPIPSRPSVVALLDAEESSEPTPAELTGGATDTPPLQILWRGLLISGEYSKADKIRLLIAGDMDCGCDKAVFSEYVGWLLKEKSLSTAGFLAIHSASCLRSGAVAAPEQQGSDMVAAFEALAQSAHKTLFKSPVAAISTMPTAQQPVSVDV